MAAAGDWLTHVLMQSLTRTLTQGLAQPTPGPSGGFDWNKVHPDPAAVPRSDLFYQLVNGIMFLGVASAVAGLVSGAIAFGIGPLFGAHIVSDRGKSMMWKNGLVALIVGSATAIVAFLLTR